MNLDKLDRETKDHSDLALGIFFLLKEKGIKTIDEAIILFESFQKDLDKEYQKLGRPVKDFNKSLANKLLFDRKWSQRKVANYLGVSVATINRYVKTVDKNDQ